MNRIVPILAAAFVLAQTAAPATAAAVSGLAAGLELPTQVVTVSGQCRAVGQRVASQHGGRLASVNAETRNGRTVCVGVVVVPPRDGKTGETIPFEEAL